MNEAGEVHGAAVVAGREATEMLEATEASLDLVAMLVNGRMVRDGDLAVTRLGDHGDGVHGCDPVAQVVAVIRFVGKNGSASLAFEQGGAEATNGARYGWSAHSVQRLPSRTPVSSRHNRAPRHRPG
ncbi:hypothetical protein [Rhizobium sp. 9140]|uniref:hypothetical protein n=1 Tax=Rhizobium sp. 9140 TaxID=1761900 RepID=UPI001FDA4884|nr:hypothetical protein [Rhizobium sp. 9140]